MVSVRAQAGDGQLGVDGKHPIKFTARRIGPAEMGQRDDFGPHRYDQSRLVMQRTVGPFDR